LVSSHLAGEIEVPSTMTGGKRALHFVTDYITSRISSKLWAKQDWHRFFVTIGFDQLIHQATLAFTLWVMVAR
jgi:hypothetical protein